MKKKQQKKIKVRLPMEAVKTLRSKGGPQSTNKGKKGYNKKKERQKKWRAEPSSPSKPRF